MNRSSMNIIVHIERLVVDDRLKMNLQAFEAAIVHAVSEAALLQAPMLGRLQTPHEVPRDWATHLGCAIQQVAGSALGAAAANTVSGKETP